MAIRNSEIASILRRYAGLLALTGENPHRVRALRRAADSLDSADQDVAAMLAQGVDLQQIPGVGKGIGAMVQEIVAVGELPRLRESLQTLPPEQIELLDQPRLDPGKILEIYRQLGIASLADLRARSDSGLIEQTFGKLLAEHVRQGLDNRPRMLLSTADRLAAQVEERLLGAPGVVRLARTGSLRRRQSTTGDLSYLLVADSPEEVWGDFAQFAAVQSAASGDDSRLDALPAAPARSFHLACGRRVKLTCAAADAWGSTLVQQTGSRAHLKQLHAWSTAALSPCREEDEVYTRLGLAPIPPELREGCGEIEAAATGRLPSLLRRNQIRGDLHMHTTASDGTHSLVEMVQMARSLGYEYIAITDHSQSLKIANGLSEARLWEQIKAIDRLNDCLEGFTVLKSAEVDILQDGSLDYSTDILKELDFTICSIHSHFALGREEQTDRVLRAMDHPQFCMLGHASGRKLLHRPGYELDLERIMRHAAQRRCCFEINSNPNRLDLSDEQARLAKELGIKLAINTDAHSTEEMHFMAFGVDQGRRGWLEPGDVLNTLPLDALRSHLRR